MYFNVYCGEALDKCIHVNAHFTLGAASLGKKQYLGFYPKCSTFGIGLSDNSEIQNIKHFHIRGPQIVDCVLDPYASLVPTGL